MVLELVKVHVAYPVEFSQQLATAERGQEGPVCVRAYFSPVESQNTAYAAFEWDSVGKALAYWNSNLGRREVASWRSVAEPQFQRLHSV